jgi:hypothetical protein
MAMMPKNSKDRMVKIMDNFIICSILVIHWGSEKKVKTWFFENFEIIILKRKYWAKKDYIKYQDRIIKKKK